MAKRSQRRLVQHERGQSGCMSGFIGIFDFRQGRSTRKLLSDKRHGSSRHAAGTAPDKSRPKMLNNSDKKDQGSNANADSSSDGDETDTLKVAISKRSVKKLIEEDMSNEQQPDKQIPNAMEQIRSDTDYKGVVGKNHRQTKKTCKVSSDIRVQDSKVAAALGSQEYYQPSSARKVSNLDITSLVEEFCQELHLHHESRGDSCGVQECMKHNHLDELDMHLIQKHSVLQEKLTEAAEAFLNQKLIDTKQLTQDGAIPQSKQFLDALEILSSNKELLSKLLQNSNPLLVKHIRDLQDAPSEKFKQDKLTSLSEETGNSTQAEELVCRKEAQKHNIPNFFRKKDKGQKRNSSKKSDDPQVSNRIVILKPKATGIQNSVTVYSPSSSPQSHYSLRNQGGNERSNSQFSLTEIKRKLKNTMGENRKDRHLSFMDGILHRFPNKHHESGNSGKVDPENIDGRELPSKSHIHIERTTEPSNNREGEDKIEKTTPCYPSTAHEVASTSAASCKKSTMTTVGYPKQRESNIYVEAKKHLEEILTGGGEDRGFSYPQSPKTLGRILSLPDYTLTPLGSPGREGEHGFVTAQMRFSPNGSFQIINENIWRFKPDNNASCPSSPRKNVQIEQDAADGDDSDIKRQEFDSNPDSSEKFLPHTEIHESVCSSKEDTSHEGDVDIMEETDGASLEEDNLPNGPSKSNSNTPFISTGTAKMWEEDPSKCLRLESSQDDRPPSSSLCSFSSSSLLIQKAEIFENTNDPSERPSPISVLEPFFDDINSPTSTTPQAELHIQRLHFHVEEDDRSTVVVTTSDLHNYPRPCMEDKIHPFDYVTAVLQASNICWEELLGKYHCPELLLNPALYDEVELMSVQQCGDRELLFDCINEVLGELYERYFGSSPWVAFVSPDIRPAPVGEFIVREVWEGIKWNLLPQLMPRTLDQIIGKDMERARTWMDVRSDAEVIGNEMVEAILEEVMEDTLFDLCS